MINTLKANQVKAIKELANRFKKDGEMSHDYAKLEEAFEVGVQHGENNVYKMLCDILHGIPVETQVKKLTDNSCVIYS